MLSLPHGLGLRSFGHKSFVSCGSYVVVTSWARFATICMQVVCVLPVLPASLLGIRELILLFYAVRKLCTDGYTVNRGKSAFDLSSTEKHFPRSWCSCSEQKYVAVS